MPARKLRVVPFHPAATLDHQADEPVVYRQYEAVGQELADHSGYLIVGGHDAEVTADDLGEVARARGGIAGKANSPGKPGQHRARSTRAAARIGDLEHPVMIFHTQSRVPISVLHLPFFNPSEHCHRSGPSLKRFTHDIALQTGARFGGEEVRQAVEIAWRYWVYERH